MRWPAILAMGIAAIAIAVVVAHQVGKTEHTPAARDVVAPENSPVCPWREPGRDLATLFPEATGYTVESHILSGVMVEAQRRLGRRLAPDENPLRVFRAHRAEQMLGSIIVHRVKGEHGGIEIVTALDPLGVVERVLVQSQREPAAVVAAITDSAWLAQFQGKTARSDFRVQAGESISVRLVLF